MRSAKFHIEIMMNIIHPKKIMQKSQFMESIKFDEILKKIKVGSLALQGLNE